MRLKFVEKIMKLILLLLREKVTKLFAVAEIKMLKESEDILAMMEFPD